MAYTVIADSDIDPESPITVTLMTALRDNSLPYKIIEIGPWDMDATNFITKAHGLVFADIVSYNAFIYLDTAGGNSLYPIDFSNTGTDTAGRVLINGANIEFARIVGGFFDSASFDSTTAPLNRGYGVIRYTIP